MRRLLKHQTILIGLLVHFLLLHSVIEVYFSSPLDHEIVLVKSIDTPAAKRLVLFVADGLRSEAVFDSKNLTADRIPFLYDVINRVGSWGVSHTRVPTESRPGHVAILAGIFEDPSAILKGWKANPVEFDSVINQSTNAWCWGSPDILNVFKTNREADGKLNVFTYGAEMEDFGEANSSLLDTWVFERVEKFLLEDVQNCENCDKFHAQGNLFFLHLLGIDTAGHGFKPHSPQYINNIKLVDGNVRRIATLFEEVFKDNLTAFIFTSDHGMTDWGSHGSGTDHETQAPLVAWGAGVKRNHLRQDVNQIDLAPLISSLLGINYPANSLGVVPTGYLGYSEGKMAKVVLNNAKQLFEVYKKKREKIENNALVHVEFKELSLRELEELERTGKYKEVVKKFIDEVGRQVINGIGYYQNYYKYPILLSVTIGFLLWIVYLVSLIAPTSPTWSPKASWSIRNVLKYIILSLVVFLCFRSKFNLMYYTYFLFPFLMYFYLNLNFTIFAIFNILKTHMAQTLLYFLGTELLVYGFFNRISFTFLLILTSLWYLPRLHKMEEKLIWISLCLLLAIFPTLPVMKTSFNIPIFVIGYVGWVLIFAKVYSKVKITNHPVFLIQFLCLQLAAIYSIALELEVISNDSPIKYFSWLIALVPIVAIFFTKMFIAVRLVATFFGFAPFYLLVSPNFEAIFLVFYVAILCTWLLIETKTFQNQHKLIYYYKFQEYQPIDKVTPDHIRRAFLFTVFIFVGFFGTGNLASLNSFDPMWVRAFLTVFNPFKMAGLILLKLLVPFVFTCCVFRAVNALGKENVLKMFCIVLVFSDLMLVHFLYLITNEGSWLDIGTSLSHFLIMETFVVVLMVLYGVAHLITSVTLVDKSRV